MFFFYRSVKVFQQQKQNRGGKILGSNVATITDPEGKKIVLINDIRFRGKTKKEW